MNMRHRLLTITLAFTVCFVFLNGVQATNLPNNYVAGSLVQLNDNGAWSWFMDERVIVTDGN